MAKGRIIVNEITKDKRVSELDTDTSRLAFTWLITFADREGRTHGDPAVVRSMLFPRRDDITLAQVESFLQEWHDCGLVIWYRSNGDQWVQFPSFHKHQVGFDKRHEPESVIPSPPVDSDGTYIVRTPPVQSTGNVPPKGSEVKRSEKNMGDAKEPASPNIDDIDLFGDDTPPPKPKKPPTVIPPAVQVYREVTNLFPAKALWENIERVVGQEPEKLSFWKKVVKGAVAMGWNKKNIDNMINYFKRGEVPSSLNWKGRKDGGNDGQS
jgi:hypothetical protein